MGQASNSASREKRQSQRFWLVVVLLAAALITLPILPPNPRAYFNFNSTSLNNFNQTLISLLHRSNDSSFTLERDSSGASGPDSSKGSMAGIRPLTEALEGLNEQIRQTPNDPSLNNRIGILYGQLGECDAACDHFNAAIDASRGQIANWLSRERNSITSGDRTCAAEAVLAISKLKVELAAAHSNLAHIYDKMGKHDRVIAQLDQLNKDIAWASEDSVARSSAGRLAILGDNQTINSFAGNDSAGAGSRLDSTTAQGLAKGQALLQERRLNEAAQEYRKLISMNPRLAIAHQQLGLTAALSNDLGTAIGEFETAVRLDPKDANSHNDLGIAYMEEHNDALAKTEFTRACLLDPKNMDAAINLANLMSADGQYDEAIQALQKALSFNQNSAIGHNNLATLLSLTDRPKEAVTEFEYALRLKPDLASAHYGLGLAYFNMQSYPAAIREFKRALTYNPSLDDAINKIEQASRKHELAANSGTGFN
jgi:tetratricopeptide (TPR) repeat protein